jgi:trans-aconitate 2-methyltransferase
MFEWDADLYSQFLQERTRPALELIMRVPLAPQAVSKAIDLGCGPGNSSQIVKKRFAQAAVLGVDNSVEMLEQARRDHPDISFALGDIGKFESFESKDGYDLIFSNAALHWVEDHQSLLPQLFEALKPGGCLAIQMPNNHNEETHKAMRTTALLGKSQGLWQADLTAVRQEVPVLSAEQYYEILLPLANHIDIWQTRYYHVMDGAQGVAKWLSGTGMRPFLAPLDTNEQGCFLKLYCDEINRTLPPRSDGKTLMPFPRLFVVAVKC